MDWEHQRIIGNTMILSTPPRKANVALRITGMLVAALSIAFWRDAPASPGDPRHVSNSELRAEKHGRVIDADTGAGIPGVMLIANWRTDSTGNGWVEGGAWCDLQKIVTTDSDGQYSIPEVSHELDLSDRGTRSGLTSLGWLTTTHEKDWVLSTFKLGYVRVTDMNATPPTGTDPFSRMYLQTPPDVRFANLGKVEVKPIALRKLQLPPPELWSYYKAIFGQMACRDRMSNNNSQQERGDILGAMRDDVRPMPCAMSPETVIIPDAFNSFNLLAHGGSVDLPFLRRVKNWENIPESISRLPYDPTERIATTAANLCRAVKEEDSSK